MHVAHVLWGGLLMLVALVLLLAVLGRQIKRLAAVIGGVGFGLFVDELGKFLTADSDYFYQPAVALIYVVLVSLFLVFRALERRSLSSAELLANAADMVRELVLGGVTEDEVARARSQLARSGAEGPLADAIRHVVAAAVTIDAAPSLATRLAADAWRLYDVVLGWHWYRRAVLLLFAGQALLGLLGTAAVIGGSAADGFDWFGPPRVLSRAAASGEIGLAAAATAALFVAIGVIALARGARLAAYRWFERSVLVAVLVTQVVLFRYDQLAALGGLAWNLLLLSALRYTIRQEAGRAALAMLGPEGEPDTRAAPD
jgi:hypothetical protein